MLLYLPHELIIEILLRLPVKSLICFKCVCKSWFSLISAPHFANSQFQLTTHTHRIMCISKFPTEFCSIDFDAFVNYDPNFVSHFSVPRSQFPFRIIGSCRGFIFLNCGSHTYLWNPSTGFKKQIPLSTFASKLKTNYRYNYMYGFGYDESRDDYLVVVSSIDSTFFNNFSSHLELFSIRDNRWKEIGGSHLPYHTYGKGLFFSGAIHWLAFRPDLVIDVIVAFDLMERKLFEIPLPDKFDQPISSDSGLWVFKEFLSLSVTGNGLVEIWVMKEYKLNLSWTKILALTLNIPDFDFPMFYTKNGDSDIIGTTSPCSKSVKYNYKGQLMGYHTFRKGPFHIVTYTESLLSLPCDNEQNYKVEE